MTRLELIKQIKSFKCVCWYPSARYDFKNIIKICEKEDPNETLFIHTDYNVTINKIIEQFNTQKYKLGLTTYRARVIESKGIRLNVKFVKDLCSFDKSSDYGKGLILTLRIESTDKTLKPMFVHVLYVIAENASFAFNFLLPNSFEIQYIVAIDYGNKMGGSKNISGNYLWNLLEAFKTENFINNVDNLNDLKYLEVFIKKCGKHLAQSVLKSTPPVKTFNRNEWHANYKNVNWFKINKTRG